MSCSRRWAAALPSHATARSASQSHHRGRREHFDALRASAVRGPHHRLPVLAHRHASAGVWLPALRGRVRQGQRIPVEPLLEFPGYGYLLREQLLHIFMHYICLCLNMCHQSAIGFVAAACLYCLHQISFSCLSITYLFRLRCT